MSELEEGGVSYSVNPDSNVILREFSRGECEWQVASRRARLAERTTLRLPRGRSDIRSRSIQWSQLLPLATRTCHSAAAVPRCQVTLRNENGSVFALPRGIVP